MTNVPQSFDQYLAALSEWLHPVIVANHLPEAMDLYCAGATIEQCAQTIALTAQIADPNTFVI